MPADREEAPDVLRLCIDQHRFDVLGATHDAVSTPRIDALADRMAATVDPLPERGGGW